MKIEKEKNITEIKLTKIDLLQISHGKILEKENIRIGVLTE